MSLGSGSYFASTKEVSVLHLLIIEDCQSDLALICHSIDDAGLDWTIDSVSDGETALKYLLQQDEYARAPIPNMVILDLGLPNVSGVEVLRYIRDTARLAHMPVVVLTASQAQEDIVDTYNLSANCYIRKRDNLKGMVTQVRAIADFWFEKVRLPRFDGTGKAFA